MSFGPRSAMAVALGVEVLDLAGVEVDALDAAADVVGRLLARAAAMPLHVVPLEAAVVADVELAVGADRRAVRDRRRSWRRPPRAVGRHRSKTKLKRGHKTVPTGSAACSSAGMMQLPLAAAGGRHDHLHRDVAAGRGARRDQPVAGFSGFRLRPGPHRGGGAPHARRPQPVRADAGGAGAARGHRGDVPELRTGGSTIPRPRSPSLQGRPRRSSTRSPRWCIRATR